ncbi:MAG TPA: TraR/DksA C4-type zinc finger protein [Acidimicrobiales bacterium]|nr:TraR/DksA C4-type zinc finger protein [Acidimicrobiales bacterium]
MEDDDARRRLAEERARLDHLRSNMDDGHIHDEGSQDAAADLSHVHQHLADTASDAFEREKEFSILEQVEAELADVDRALERLDAGTYGTCEACGGTIPDERLAAVPAARFCAEHQAEAEV